MGCISGSFSIEERVAHSIYIIVFKILPTKTNNINLKNRGYFAYHFSPFYQRIFYPKQQAAASYLFIGKIIFYRAV